MAPLLARTHRCHQDDLRRAAWACVTAGASFTWNGHESEYELYAGGPTGLPFNEENSFRLSERYIDILTRVMQNDVEFYRMKPHDELLAHQQPLRVYALAEPGRQYLVFAPDGEPFSLKMEAGTYSNGFWIDTLTGEKQALKSVSAQGPDTPVAFTAPNRTTDWVLVVRQ